MLRRGAWSYQIKDENGQIKTVKEEQPHELKIFETDLGAARGLAAELANERPTGTRRYAGLRQREAAKLA